MVAGKGSKAEGEFIHPSGAESDPRLMDPDACNLILDAEAAENRDHTRNKGLPGDCVRPVILIENNDIFPSARQKGCGYTSGGASTQDDDFHLRMILPLGVLGMLSTKRISTGIL